MLLGIGLQAEGRRHEGLEVRGLVHPRRRLADPEGSPSGHA
uniref:Uncharacterized protein n=1 Tax=Anguilla anguilla TaxID=7936 RepID=A0A0E9VQE5_ANGAN